MGIVSWHPQHNDRQPGFLLRLMSTYILGTGLSHDGSTCILKDGEIIVAIEKERLTRIKHDGGNDYLAVKYCLEAAGIKVNDLSLIVQAANFEIDIQPDKYKGRRYFEQNLQVPLITISHHLAHAWSAAATSPFEECNVMVIDGAGSPYDQCGDLNGAIIPPLDFTKGLFCEKDSFYHFDGKVMKPVFKDFSEVRLFEQQPALKLPTNYHSVGGLYNAASSYCFGNMDDPGKLMGLAPYGELDGKPPIFKLENGRVEVIYETVNALFTRPAADYADFKQNFNHYAGIARWVQHETEKAVQYLFTERIKLSPGTSMAYAGGVALNAVANHQLLKSAVIKNLFMQPAAGDNGLAIGCAYYGWMALMGNGKPTNHVNQFLGRVYGDDDVMGAIKTYEQTNQVVLNYILPEDIIQQTAGMLAEGKVVGWYRGGAEFGPRALGHRSILADPRNGEVRDHININIKFREDFRPFAPAVLEEDVNTYFKFGWHSPYMILVDEVRNEWRDKIPAVVHQDGTSRVQTVSREWNADFYDLLTQFKQKAGIGLLLNTSLNRKGMPIVETPIEAIELFFSGAMDVLVLNNVMVIKD